MLKKTLAVLISVVLVVAMIAPAAAQDMTPSVTVSDQFVTDSVVIDSVTSAGPGFVVIHTDNGGSPGPVIGYASVPDGTSTSVRVPLDYGMAAPTPVLYAMLHTDDNEVGTYEFGTVEGADGPVAVDGNVVTPAFNAWIIDAASQFVTDGSVTIDNVTTDTAGWIVIHSDNGGAPGPVLGQTQVSAGNNAGVAVTLNGEATATLWPMLHVDTGEAGVYEFGTVEGADGPVVVNGSVAVTSFSTVPSVNAQPQIVVHGDGMDMAMMDMAPTFTADEVLSEGAGWLVIHADGGGSPGPVLGQTQVSAGLNENVTVELATDGLTPVLWPMLHVDTGEAGVYEFGTVEGADGPVAVDGNVVTFPVNAAPSFSATEQAAEGGTIVIDEVLIDAPGWMVIHSDNGGSPGPVIGQTFVPAGLSRNVSVSVDASMVGTQVFPMLHYDTGEAGVYEFGTVEGADAPVSVNGNVVVGPLAITGGEMMEGGAEEAAEPMETPESAG